MGVNPDIIILRADGSVGGDIRRKISTFCNVKPECVIENLTMPSLYQCPLMLHTDGLDEVVVEKLKLDVPRCRPDRVEAVWSPALPPAARPAALRWWARYGRSCTTLTSP